MNVNNKEFVEFCKSKIGTPYVMGTSGKVFTESMYNDLVKRNPANWFTSARLPQVRKWIGKRTADCHGLIEWFIREATGKAYDVTADSAYNSATEKGAISTIPEIIGLCVRYSGHVGVYIGNGKVVEARGFDYGTCITDLKKRPWTHWYKHSKIDYSNAVPNKAIKYDITAQMSVDEIQQVLDKGGKITCENAVYNVAKTLKLKSNTELNFNGATFRQGAKMEHIFVTDTTADTVGYEGAHNIEIYGGTLEGMGKYNTPLNLLTLYHAKNVSIHDVIFKDVVGFHHLEINACANVCVDKCHFSGYNVIDKDDDFRECIQIDCATQSALVIHPLGSATYDGTACKNIQISECQFTKSDSRPAPSVCIGNHCQFENAFHSNVSIERNVFIGGNQNDSSGTCINLVGMENVKISENSISKYGRAVRMYSYNKSYNAYGKKQNALKNDGKCSNVIVSDNNIASPIGTNAVKGIWAASNNARHNSIVVSGNFIQDAKCKLNYCDGGYVSDDCEIAKTCFGVYKE